MKAGRKKESENPSIREYQAIRDFTLAPGGAGVIDCYMELVAQFGFIVLFSEIFPPATLFPLFAIIFKFQVKSTISVTKGDSKLKFLMELVNL